MPSLLTVTSATTHAESVPCIAKQNFILDIKAPTGNSGTGTSCLADATTPVNIYHTFSIPSQLVGYFSPQYYADIGAAPASTVLTAISGIFLGNDTPTALNINCVVPNSTAYTPNAGVSMVGLAFLLPAPLKHAVAGGF